MVKRDGIWKIAHFQNTVIDPKAESDDPQVGRYRSSTSAMLYINPLLDDCGIISIFACGSMIDGGQVKMCVDGLCGRASLIDGPFEKRRRVSSDFL
jgi:hypothetical protein